MADSKNLYIKPIANVIQGWNEKLQLTDDQLSMMIPFCDLYAIYRDEKAADRAEQNLINSGFQVLLKDYSGSPENVILVPVFNILEQQTTVDNSVKGGKLLRPRGVGGISSAEISTWNPDLGSYRIVLQIEVPSFDEDVQLSKAIRRLTIPGTDWIIAYGWARDNSAAGKPFAPIVDKIIDLTASNKGYYRFLKSQLWEFNWRINSNRIVSGSLEFWPDVKATGLLAVMSTHRGQIKELMSNEITLKGNCRETAKGIYEQLKGFPVSRKVKRDVYETSGEGRKKVVKEVDGYYSLGWIIEAMRQAMVDPKKPRIKHIIFEDWVDKKTTKIMFNADGDKQSIPITFISPAEIPIPIDILELEVIDLMTNESLLWSIDRVCFLANKQLINASELFTEISSDGTTISIRDANDLVWNVGNRTNSMKLGVSTPNSLLMGIELGSKVPINLTHLFNYFITTDEGATILYNMYEKEALDTKKSNEKISETAKLIRKFNKTIVGDKKALDANRLSTWRKFLKTDDSVKIEKIQQDVSSSQTVPVGLALRNYFKTITVEIHGTALIPPATQLQVAGILPGIDGKYQVISTTDTLYPGNFTSKLEANLLSTD
jgi:hypothetical protein